MRSNHLRTVLYCCLIAGICAGTAQAATVAYWKFDEKAPGNPASFVAGAIQDGSGNGHNGTAYGGDPFADPDRPEYVHPFYVDGATGAGDSALRMTLQDWSEASSYVGVEEDVVLVPSSSDFDINLSISNIYTIEAIIRAPDPMEIMNSAVYSLAYPQWYDYTSNCIIDRGGTSAATMTNWWALSLRHDGRIYFDVKDSSNVMKESHGLQSVTGGLWHQVAVKVFGSPTPENRKLQLYIDGQLDNEVSISSLSGVVASGKQIDIGSGRDAMGARWSDQFIGDIDAVRISTGAVTFLPTPINTIPTLDLAHTGLSDPTTEAHLKLVDASDTEAPTSTWTPVGGLGGNPDSGRLQEYAGSYAYYRGLAAPEQFRDPTGWTLTAAMKLGASNKPWNTSVGVEDGQDTWVMSFMDSTFTQTSGGTGAGVYRSGEFDYTGGAGVAHFTGVIKMGSTNPTDGFHTYQMYFDPTTDKVNFYVDGYYIGEQTRAEAWDTLDPDRGTRLSSDSRFWFGDAFPVFERSPYFVGDTASDAYWGDVKLETGCHVVPEPSTFVLLSVGVVFLLVRRLGR